MTNFDKIRTMSEEEFLEKFGDSICDMIEDCPYHTTCAECKRQWLKQEAKEGGDENAERV